jgi:hypothetical protein
VAVDYLKFNIHNILKMDSNKHSIIPINNGGDNSNNESRVSKNHSYSIYSTFNPQ